jgi:putative Mg2+ transporter-C (MgtC) family protein
MGLATGIAEYVPLPLLQADMVMSLLIAVLLGALMGLERSLAGKQAGMRTYALVSMGSCLFVIIGTLSSLSLGPLFAGINPLQIAASVVIGIGFIGSGLALAKQGEHVELTTASGFWVAAGVGMACGFGFYFLAFAAALFAVATFSLLLSFENLLRKHFAPKKEKR